MSAKLWRSQEEEWTSNITRVKTGSKSVWRSDELETRCGRESQHPAEWALRPPIEQLLLERRCWKENMSQRGWVPRPPVEQPGEQERNTVMAVGVGVNMLQFCSVSNSLSHTTLSIKWEVYFFKELCRSSLLYRRYDSACICIWVCNT